MSTDLIYDKEAGVVTSRGNFIYTYTGLRFYPLDPRADEMVIEDIAHSLALSCRFTGHVKKFYSVGEHCVRMAREAERIGLPKELRFVALMHDCSEAYLIDVPRPLKASPYFGAYYKKAELRIMDEAAVRFGFEWPMAPEIEELDHIMLNTEQRDLMPELANLDGPWFPTFRTLDPVIRPWSPTKVEREFLAEFDALT